MVASNEEVTKPSSQVDVIANTTITE